MQNLFVSLLPSLPNISFADFVVYFLFAIVVFLIIREALTWYWKINRIVSLLEKIEENTSPLVPKQPQIEPTAKEPQGALGKWWNGTK